MMFHTNDSTLTTPDYNEDDNVEIVVNDDSAAVIDHGEPRSDVNSTTNNSNRYHRVANFNVEQSTSSDGSLNNSISEWMSDVSDDSARGLFEKAQRHINFTTFFRYVMYLYAERKLVVFFGIHFVSTMIIWGHFALIKFNKEIQNVPEDANRYLWKIIAPPVEFGSMHAILFQMALIPITMSRFSISALSDSVMEKILPLNRALRIHIHLGWVMITIVCLATIFFFAFFGLLCADGEQNFCNRFTIEIMVTGYCILGSLLIIGTTSYFRHHIPYEIFYAIHHLVFILYFVTIMHTFDNFQRDGIAKRSQTFKWFSSTLLFYFCDRAAMRLNRRYTVLVTSSSTVASDNGTSKMIVLKMRRPLLFRFKPGQYAFLQIDQIGKHWHPFSIASGPDSSHLEFYIEVQPDDNSWTGKLWNLLVTDHHGDDNYGNSSSLQLFVDVMGPYGTSLANFEDFSHVLAIGAGTGIVPILSLLKRHVRKMLQFDPTAFFKDQQQREEKLYQLTLAMEQQKGSIMTKLSSANKKKESQKLRFETKNNKLRKSIQQSLMLHDMIQTKAELQCNKIEMNRQAYNATRSIYGIVLLTLAPIIGILIIGLNISWNTLPVEELFEGMAGSLQVFTWMFQIIYIVLALFIWDATTIWSYTDVAIALVTPFADMYWYKKYKENGRLAAPAITLFSLLLGYMTFRLWIRAVQPRNKSWKTHLSSAADISTLDRLEVVWTTRSASQVSRILPDLFYVWDSLVQAWGYNNARKVCRISINVTDTDLVACNLLRLELEGTGIYVTFSRLNISSWIQKHTIEMIENRHTSTSLLAFCGSPQLAEEIHLEKTTVDMLTAITGNKYHQMQFVSESYGGPAKKKDTKNGQRQYQQQDITTTRRSDIIGSSDSSNGSNSLPWMLRQSSQHHRQRQRNTKQRILSLSTRQNTTYDRQQQEQKGTTQSSRLISPQNSNGTKNTEINTGHPNRNQENDDINDSFEDAVA